MAVPVEAEKNFSLEAVKKFFTNSKKDDGSISVDDYIEGYTELCKFFNFFGTVFGFVVSDVTSKLQILRGHRVSSCGPHYITVQSMVNFEVSSGLTKVKGKQPSGSRTLLRLHRALEFISLFLSKIKTVSDDEKLTGVASEAYSSSLSKHHLWIIQKGVGLALFSLPTKAQLLEKVAVDNGEETMKLIEEIVDSIKPVYDTVQRVYEDNNILSLP